VNLTLNVCCRFSTEIIVIIQQSLRLVFKINGNVSYPRLKILPKQIDTKRISGNAIYTHQITAKNIGTTMLKLQFFLENYSEFHISLSAKYRDVGIGRYILTASNAFFWFLIFFFSSALKYLAIYFGIYVSVCFSYTIFF